MVHESGEHAGGAAAQRAGVDSSALEDLPGGFQHQPLLRVHRQRLARRDTEGHRVEAVRVVDEPAFEDVGLARGVGVGIVEGRGVPAAVVRERADGVGARRHQVPQVLGAVDLAGVAAAHRDDGDGLVAAGGAGGPRGRRGVRRPRQLGQQVGDQGLRGGVVEDECRGQPQARHGAEPVAQFHGGQRVEAQVVERLVVLDQLRAAVPEHTGGLGPHQLGEQLDPFGLAETGEALAQRGGGTAHGARRLGQDAAGDQAPQQGRHGGGGAVRGLPQLGEVQAEGDQMRGVTRPDGVQNGQRVGGGEGGTHTADPGQSRLVQPGGDTGSLRPQAPADGDGARPAVGDGVQNRVRGRVAGLARGAEGRGDGGEQHEQRYVADQFVQVQRGGRLGVQHRVEPVGGQ